MKRIIGGGGFIMKRIIGLHVVFALLWALTPATVAHAQGNKETVCAAAIAELWRYYNRESTADAVQEAINSCATSIDASLPDTPSNGGSSNGGVVPDNPCGLGQVHERRLQVGGPFDGTMQWECVTPSIVWGAEPHHCTRIQRGVISETGADGTVTGRVVYRDNPAWIADRRTRNVPRYTVPWDCQPPARCELYDRLAGLTPPAGQVAQGSSRDMERAAGVPVQWDRQTGTVQVWHPCYSGTSPNNHQATGGTPGRMPP